MDYKPIRETIEEEVSKEQLEGSKNDIENMMMEIEEEDDKKSEDS